MSFRSSLSTFARSALQREGAASGPKDVKERRREEILRAARRVFAQKGYHQTNIADIAAVLGMGHGTFYRYFENKRDIFRCVLEAGVGEIAGIADAEAPDAADTLEEYTAQLHRIGRRLFDLFFADENVAHLLFREAL